MSEQRRIMVIGGHPADAIDLAGGTIYNHVKKGDLAIVINMTHGAYSHAGLLYDELKSQYDNEEDLYKAVIEEKHREGEAAARCVLVQEVINLGYDDEPLEMSRERVYEIAELLRQYKPDVVITHHPNEYTHEDHAVCGMMVVKALKAAAKYYPRSKFSQHFVPSVYFFGIQFLSKQVRLGYLGLPHDVLIDVSGAIEAKVDAFCAIKSQKNTRKVALERLNSLERENGRLDGLSYAETFISFYPYKSETLPVNPMKSWYHLQDELMEEK